MPAPLEITERDVNGVVVLALAGHLVADDGDIVLRERVTGLVSAGTNRIVLNLDAVAYMDSGGVGGLAAILLHVARRGGRLKLLRPNARVLRVLEITHLQSVFDIYDDEGLAIQSFEAAPTTGQFLR